MYASEVFAKVSLSLSYVKLKDFTFSLCVVPPVKFSIVFDDSRTFLYVKYIPLLALLIKRQSCNFMFHVNCISKFLILFTFRILEK